MAINLICPKCSTNLSVKSKICKNCDYEFKSRKKYRVVVKNQYGKRISKVLDSISMAKKYERKLKTQILEPRLTHGPSAQRLIHHVKGPTIGYPSRNLPYEQAIPESTEAICRAGNRRFRVALCIIKVAPTSYGKFQLIFPSITLYNLIVMIRLY